METFFIGTAFVMGIVGNFHCLGMCGPIALAIPIDHSSRKTKIQGILLYNLGRILVYAMIGSIFGLIGLGISLIGIQQYFSIFMGALLILSVLAPIIFKHALPVNSSAFSLVGKLKAQFATLLKKRSYRSIFLLGLLNGILPCGLVYVAATGSILSGSWFGGALYMMAFGIGTLPVMFLLPYLGQYLSTPFRMKLNKVIPVFTVILGILFILRGSNLGIPYLSPHVSVEESCCSLNCH